MKELNRTAADAAAAAGVKSMTDITGFGLLGHAHEMAHLGLVNFRFYLERLPFLPGALDYGRAGSFPGGMANNLDYFRDWVRFDETVPLLMQDMLWTPETSGGLLAAVAPDQVETFRRLCPAAVAIGEVLPGDGHLELTA
jgi:selenide,water dikinase